MMLIGFALLALGGWACYAWWTAIVIAVKALLAIGLVLVGLVLVVFGISEIAGARPAKRSVE